MGFEDDLGEFGRGFAMPFEFIGSKGLKLGDRLLSSGEKIGGNVLNIGEGLSDFLAGLSNNGILFYVIGGVAIYLVVTKL